MTALEDGAICQYQPSRSHVFTFSGLNRITPAENT